MKYNLLGFQISAGLKIFFTKHDCQVSLGFVKKTKDISASNSKIDLLAGF